MFTSPRRANRSHPATTYPTTLHTSPLQLTVNRWTPVKFQQVYSLKLANWESFVTATFENPFQTYCYSNVDVLLQTWYSWFHGIMEDNLKKVTKHRMSQPPWITSKTFHLQNLLKTKKQRKKKNTFNMSQALKIKKLEKQVSKQKRLILSYMKQKSLRLAT